MNLRELSSIVEILNGTSPLKESDDSSCREKAMDQGDGPNDSSSGIIDDRLE